MHVRRVIHFLCQPYKAVDVADDMLLFEGSDDVVVAGATPDVKIFVIAERGCIGAEYPVSEIDRNCDQDAEGRKGRPFPDGWRKVWQMKLLSLVSRHQKAKLRRNSHPWGLL